MFMKVYAFSICIHEAGPSINSSVVPGVFDLSVSIEVLDISSITENKEEKLRVRSHSQLPKDFLTPLPVIDSRVGWYYLQKKISLYLSFASYT